MENLFKIETNNGNAYQFSNHLNKNGFDVTFITTKSEDNKDIKNIGEVPLIIEESKLTLGRELSFPKKYLYNNKDNIDIVWCYLSRGSSYHCAKFASKHNKKLIIKCDSVTDYKGSNPLKKLWKYFTVTYPLKKANLVIAESKRVFDEVSKINPNTIIIPNGVNVYDMPNFDNVSKEKTILSIGRAEPIKGIENLIGAFKMIHREYPEWKLKIIGPLDNKEYVEELQQSVKDWDLNDYVEFTGPKYKEELYLEMAKGSVYVIASKPLGDGMNNTLPYVMYFGCTPVITDVGDISSVIITPNKKLGYLCKESDALEIYSGIKDAISNPINPKDLKSHIVSEYSWEKHLSKLLEEVNKI